jgi:ribokinase
MNSTKPKIVVVGSYNVGLTVPTPRLPVLGETLTGYSFSQGPGGKGSNQAIGAARLGAEVALIGAIGGDAFGNDALELWNSEKIDSTHINQLNESHTGIGLIMLCDGGENAIIVALGANLELTPTDVEAASDVIAEADVLITGMEIKPETSRRAAEIAIKNGTKVLWNPAPAEELPSGSLKHVDFLTPNETEARILLGLSPESEQNEIELARRLIDFGVNTVILTQGSQGATIVTNDETTKVSAPIVKVVDTTGAGDAFNGAFAVAIAEGLAIKESVRFACHAGSYCVQKFEVIPGLAMRDELDTFLSEVG